MNPGEDEQSIDIDLDVVWSQPPSTVSSPQVRRRWRGRWRWPLAALSLVMVAGLLAGGERGYDPRPVFHLAGGAFGAEVADRVLFVATSRSGGIRAYQMPGGRLLWSHDTAAAGGLTGWHAFGDVVVLSVAGDAGRPAGIEALDARTGRSLWRRDRAVAAAPSGDALVTLDRSADAAPGRPGESGQADRSDGSGDGSDPRLAETVVGLDRRTGAERWSRTLSGVETVTFVYDAPSQATWRTVAGYVLLAAADGPARAYLADSGRPVADAKVAAALSKGRRLRLETDGRVQEVFLGAGCLTLRGEASDGGQESSSSARAEESTAVCLRKTSLGRAAFGTAGNDADGHATAGRPTEIAGSQVAGPYGRLGLAITGIGGHDTEADLRGWFLVGVLGDGGDLILANTAEKDGRAVIALLDPDDRRRRVFGRETTGVDPTDCVGSDGYLLCFGQSGLGVWRLPRRH